MYSKKIINSFVILSLIAGLRTSLAQETNQYLKVFNKAGDANSRELSDSSRYYLRESLKYALNKTDSLQTYAQMGFNNYYYGLSDSAIFYGKKVMEKFNLEDFDANGRGIYANIYLLLRYTYYNQAKYNESYGYSQLARDALLMDTANWHRAIPSMMDMATEKWRLFEYEEAMDHIFVGLDFLEEGNFDPQMQENIKVRAYILLGLINYDIGFFNKALDYYLFAQKIIVKNKATMSSQYSANSNNLANLYRELNRYDEALAYYNKADSVLEAIKATRRDYTSRKVIILNNIGKIYVELDDFKQASKNLKRALSLSEAEWPEGHRLTASALVGLGDSYSAQELYPEAIEKFDLAAKMRIDDRGQQDDMLSLIYLHAGRAYFGNKDFEKAYQYYDLAILSSPFTTLENERLYTNATNAILSSMEKILSLDSLQNGSIARTDSLLGIYNTIIQPANRAFASQKHVSGVLSDFFEVVFNAALPTYQATQDAKMLKLLWEVTEYDKSRKLITHLNERSALEKTLPAGLAFRQKNLRDSIAHYTNMSISDTISYKGILIELDGKFVQLKADMEREYPEYFNLKYRHEILSTEKVHASLKKANKAVLEYYTADSIVYITALNGSQVMIKKIELDQELSQNISIFQAAIISPFNSQSHQEFVASSRVLYTRLVEPMFDILEEKDLIIVPSGELARIPFEVLLSNEVDNKQGPVDFKSLPYMIKSRSISYANSITMLSSLLKRNNVQKEKKILALAPTFIAENETLSEDDTLRGSLGNLAWTSREVELIKQHFPTDIYEGASANENTFKTLAGQYSIIHIASHALVDDINPMFSKVALSLNKSDSMNDGYLHTFELINTKLNAEMAVLSACNTGYGTLEEGEGVMSLAQGFFYSGTKSVIMSLWPANDKSTTEIMDKFYEYLSKGHSKDESLLQAKLAYLKASDNIKSHPFYWAQFIANGNMEPIMTRESNKGYRLLLVLPLILLIVTKTRKKSA